MSKTVAISMARMTSSRLRGKPLMEIEGIPLLKYHVERLKKATKIDQIVIATTTNKEDDEIEQFCNKNLIKCFRGSEEDVLSRYYLCAIESEADVIIRITGDCPLIDPVLIDQLIEYCCGNKDLDYASLDVAKYPRGFDCEFFSRAILEEVQKEAVLDYHREHVTNFIYSQPERYNIGKLTMVDDYSHLRFCVDEKDDFVFISKVIKQFGERIYNIGWQEIVNLVLSRPDIAMINENVTQHVPGGTK